MIELTHKQRGKIAHAVGFYLNSEGKLEGPRWAYRNYFQTSAGSEDNLLWQELVKVGYAEVRTFKNNHMFEGFEYKVTPKGVEAMGTAFRKKVPYSLIKQYLNENPPTILMQFRCIYCSKITDIELIRYNDVNPDVVPIVNIKESCKHLFAHYISNKASAVIVTFQHSVHTTMSRRIEWE